MTSTPPSPLGVEHAVPCWAGEISNLLLRRYGSLPADTKLGASTLQWLQQQQLRTLIVHQRVTLSFNELGKYIYGSHRSCRGHRCNAPNSPAKAGCQK